MVTVAISCNRGLTHRGPKSGGWSLTLFSDRWLLLLLVAIGVIHTGAKSRDGSVTPFSDRWLLLLSVSTRGPTQVPNLGGLSVKI